MPEIKSMGSYTLNPRGNVWFNDTNRFGSKILSKMGWSKGKGLGKKEDGIVENIKVKLKDGYKGLGWNQWSKESREKLYGVQTEEYESILSSLNEGHVSSTVLEDAENENKDKGLEQRSQKFRKRLHYHKFVRGKDVSRYSEDDIKSIFVLQKTSSDKNLSEDGNSTKSCTFNTMADSFETYNNLNSTDYFAMKMKAKSSESHTLNSNSADENIVLLNSVEVEDANAFSAEGTQMSKKRKRSKDPEEASNSFQCKNELPSMGAKMKSTAKRKKSQNESKKSKKLKLGIYTNLKSCLKSKSIDFSKKKEVSFNDSVSYRIIESELSENELSEESTGSEKSNDGQPLNEEQELTAVHNETSCEIKDSEKSNDGQTLNKKELTAVSNEVGSEEIPVEEPIEKYKCFELPKKSSSNYNSWIETQRQALKMNVYKNVLKNIRKHNVLKTTNLLSIKGYGNWGF